MSNYTQTTNFTAKDALLSGNPAKLIKGADFDVEFAAIAAAVATKLDNSQAANPTGTVGLTAVNGSASTYMRSDGAPALSQAIVPTWTGIHTFSATPVLNAGLTAQNAGGNSAVFNQSTASTDAITRYQLTGTDKLLIALAGAANNIITGSIIGDTNIRTPASQNILFSVNGGASPQFKIASTGIVQAQDQAGTLQDIGWRDLPPNSQTGTYTAVLADRGKAIILGGGAGVGVIPANASVAYPLGTVLTFINANGAPTTVSIASDSLTLAGTASVGTRTIPASSYMVAIKAASATWFASGPGVS